MRLPTSDLYRLMMVIRGGLVCLLCCVATACASDPKEVRPHLQGMSGPHLATGTLAYVFQVSPGQVYEAMEAVLRDAFPTLQVRKQQKADLERFNRYGEIRTEFVRYKDGSKEYRKKCTGDVYLIPQHAGYTKATLSCHLDVYELGLTSGRGGIHNIFTQWWDWYPEPGLYAAEDLLELISRKLALPSDRVIKLNKKDFYPDAEVVQIIETQKR